MVGIRKIKAVSDGVLVLRLDEYHAGSTPAGITKLLWSREVGISLGS